MYLEISIEPFLIQKETSILREDKKFPFPVAIVGKESYAMDTVVAAGITEDHHDCYNLQIGNFCSLARECELLMNQNHDYKSVAMGELSILTQVNRTIRIKRKGEIIIENDVWIGQGATIMSGVTIQNGAVVAAGAVVTKNVPAYAIVGGTPAKVLKYRFEPEQIRKLLDIQWWYWSMEQMEKYKEDFTLNIDQFIENHYGKAREKIENIHCNYEKTKEIVLFVPDFDSEYPIYPKVMKEYCESSPNNISKQFLVLILDDRFVEDHISKVVELLDCFYDGTGDLVIQTCYEHDIEAYISISDYFITARNMKTVYYSSLAHKYGVKTISGVDIPIFDLESGLY